METTLQEKLRQSIFLASAVTQISSPKENSPGMSSCCWQDTDHWRRRLRVADLLRYDGRPEPEICAFCGRPLYYLPVPRDATKDTFQRWDPIPERCTCTEGMQWWERYDAAAAAKREKETRAREAAAHDELIAKALGKAGVGERFRHLKFDSFETETDVRKEAKTAALAYVNDYEKRGIQNGEGFMICGPPGTGKTHLALAIAQELIERGYGGIVYRTSPMMFKDLSSTYNAATEICERDMLRMYTDTDLFILDDLGQENSSAWTTSQLFIVLDGRYAQKKPTIVTTNFSLNELKQALTQGGKQWTAEAIISRLKQQSWMRTIYLGGMDYRESE